MKSSLKYLFSNSNSNKLVFTTMSGAYFFFSFQKWKAERERGGPSRLISQGGEEKEDKSKRKKWEKLARPQWEVFFPDWKHQVFPARYFTSNRRYWSTYEWISLLFPSVSVSWALAELMSREGRLREGKRVFGDGFWWIHSHSLSRAIMHPRKSAFTYGYPRLSSSDKLDQWWLKVLTQTDIVLLMDGDCTSYSIRNALTLNISEFLTLPNWSPGLRAKRAIGPFERIILHLSLTGRSIH